MSTGNLWLDALIFATMVIGAADLLPQTLRTYRQKHAHGMSRSGLILITLDKLLNIGVMIALGVGPLVIKYILGALCVAYLCYYRFYVTPHRED